VRKEEHGVFAVLSDTQQKVFEIKDDRSRFAFAVTGTAAFTADGEAEIIFDFNEAIPSAANALKVFRLIDATSYCERLARTVNKTLKDSVAAARANGKTVTLVSNPDPAGQGRSMIATLFLCGFYLQTSCHVLF
jgi:hypothetical protein